MLHVRNLDKTYQIGTFGTGSLRAVRNVSFDVARGEVVSLIGESGSGKSTIGKMVLRLISTTAGSIEFDGTEITGLERGKLRGYYRRAQGVFQDPFSSYNPIFKVDRVFDTLRSSYFPTLSKAEWQDRLASAITSVSLEPGTVLGKYPHQLSGGQLQRLLIARALLLDIELLVADEIISMLDASTRIDVLNLLGELRAKGLGILFVTHDLSLGNYVSDRVIILYQGRIVESGITAKVFGDPLHPYTRRLLASVPQLDAKWEDVEEAQAARGAALEGRCPFHELSGREVTTGRHDAATGRHLAATGLVDVADGHQVGCFAMSAADPCPLTGDRS